MSGTVFTQVNYDLGALIKFIEFDDNRLQIDKTRNRPIL